MAPLDLFPPPRILADPTDDLHAVRRAWAMATFEKVAAKDQGDGYAGLDANGRQKVDQVPLTRSRVRNAGNVSGNVTWSALGGNIVNFTAVGDCTFAGAANPVDGMDLRAIVTASGGARTIAFSAATAVPIYPVGHLPASVVVPSGLVLVADLIYSTAAAGWLLVSCDVERPAADQGTCYAVSAAAQSIGSNPNPQPAVAFGTDVQTTALVTKATSGAGHTFTLQRTGLWALWFSLLFTANVIATKRGHLAQSGGGSGVPGILTGGSGYTSATSGQGSVFCSGAVPAVRLLAGTVLTVTAYQGTTSGGTSDSLVSGSCSFGATFLGP